ncbi:MULTISPECIES: ABC transporter substrate-binding protein [unclassified Aminobacter]|uniref:ABC transporter substrate-binding protein n=1 Tax=unclassified Aminobacter TaxID=2644704 RepID=UPI000464F52B|nr:MULTISPECIES: ABC transporter substrate-binding protein [unclassified Aminobacter]TWG67555.1 branched-chain amino acid transport system substrate-binding protein [Aminobacter sp. J44]TWH35526.1 branched-chain amino acid transport system substrate-binding protein [Aminobacter sp. J15]
MLTRRVTLALGVALAMSTSALAQETVKIGVILPYSGPFADAANQLQAGIDLYIAKHGDTVAGKKIELIKKDTGGPNADTAQRAAQELVVRDGADIIAGFALTPEALGAAPVAEEAQKLMVVMNAATSNVTEQSEYIVRTGVTIPQVNYALGKWAFEEGGVKQAYTLVSDYGPGHDAEKSFSAGFTEAGGKMLGSDRTPVANPDFSAFVQRVKDANPEAVYIFVPGGAQPAAIGKALADRGLNPPATKIFAQGELTHPEALESMGENARGIITTFHYTLERDDPLNKEFVDGYTAANNGRQPDLFSIGGYDGMHLIYEALKKTNGDASGDALLEAAKGMSWDSPRGPMSIDPETRDVVQTVYIREVQEVDGKLQNVVIHEIPNVKDPLH